MALLIDKPSDIPGITVGYWIIDRIEWDKSTGKTKIWISGFLSQEQRMLAFPVALSRTSVVYDSIVSDVAAAYEVVKTTDGFSEATEG